jgi:hypothetical protein
MGSTLPVHKEAVIDLDFNSRKEIIHDIGHIHFPHLTTLLLNNNTI